MITSSSFRLLGVGVRCSAVSSRAEARLLGSGVGVTASLLTTLSLVTLFGTPLGRPSFFFGGTMGAGGSLEPEAWLLDSPAEPLLLPNHPEQLLAPQKQRWRPSAATAVSNDPDVSIGRLYVVKESKL